MVLARAAEDVGFARPSSTPAVSFAYYLLHASCRRLAASSPSSSSPLSSAQQPPSSASAPSSAAATLLRACLSASAAASETSVGLGCAPGSSRKLSHRPHLVGNQHMNSQYIGRGPVLARSVDTNVCGRPYKCGFLVWTVSTQDTHTEDSRE